MSIPEYKKWEDVPENLKTKKGLGEMGLRLAKDQKPAGVKLGWKKYPDYDLYDVSQAVPKRKLSEAQGKALEEARRKAMTTICCNRFVGHVNWREHGDMCWQCWAAEQERRHQEFLKESEREASEWARGILADPRAVILDTETTGLEGEIVEISIIKVDGTTLLDTLVKPVNEIPQAVSVIHGITNEMVKDAPGFFEVYLPIKNIVQAASRVIIYNAAFDTSILYMDCRQHELPKLEFKSECAMKWYAAFVGEWSEYYGSFRWQRLEGGHRALGDCLATLEVIKIMAKSEEYGQGAIGPNF